MATDDDLQATLKKLSAASRGRVSFAVRTAKDLSTDLGVDLGKSRSQVYDFQVKVSPQNTFRCVAYTNLVDGSSRTATRAEHLAAGIAVAKGKLFELNPFLLVYDHVGEQFLAVPAAVLFGAFTDLAKTQVIPKSASAAFSMSPNFPNRTISMYAEVPSSSIWHSSIEPASLTVDTLLAGLTRMRTDTDARRDRIHEIVDAVVKRLEEGVTGGAGAAQVSGVVTVPMVAPPSQDIVEPLVQVDDRVRRMVRRAIRSASAVILVGPPGTGKTALLREAIREAAVRPPLWATPDESWTTRELVGGDTIIEGKLQFRPGWVLQAVAANRWLVLDEANRADMDRIFGGLLTWLSGGTVQLGTTSTDPTAPHIHLGWNVGHDECATINADGDPTATGAVKYLAGDGWRLLGTYNALDAQRVFRFGAALGRRFVRVPIPAPEPSMFNAALDAQHGGISDAARRGIEGLYAAHHAQEATQLGPALFLAMCNYLRAASKTPAPATASPASPSGAPAPASVVTDAGTHRGGVREVGEGQARTAPRLHGHDDPVAESAQQQAHVLLLVLLSRVVRRPILGVGHTHFASRLRRGGGAACVGRRLRRRLAQRELHRP